MHDPRPEKRTRDPEIFRKLHREAKECALCGIAPPLEAHHVYPRSQGGDDVRADLVLVCHSCHERLTANDEVMRTLLGEHLMAARWDVMDYIEEKLGDEQGRDWLRRRLFIEDE